MKKLSVEVAVILSLVFCFSSLVFSSDGKRTEIETSEGIFVVYTNWGICDSQVIKSDDPRMLEYEKRLEKRMEELGIYIFKPRCDFLILPSRRWVEFNAMQISFKGVFEDEEGVFVSTSVNTREGYVSYRLDYKEESLTIRKN